MRNIIEQQSIKAAVKQIAKKSGVSFALRATVEEHVLYTRNDMTGKSGIDELIKSQDKKVDGVRNIDSARLNTGEAFVCTGIAFSVAQGQAALKDDVDMAILGFSRTMTNRGLTPFFNNEFTLKVSNKEKLKMIIRHGMATSNSDDPMMNEYCQVTPFIIDENQSILPQVNCFHPVGTKDAPVAFEMALIGYKLTTN